MAVCDVVIEIDGLAGIFFHQPLVYERPVFGGNEETRPADPGEIEGLLESREGRD
jgi:hypothetical protein